MVRKSNYVWGSENPDVCVLFSMRPLVFVGLVDKEPDGLVSSTTNSASSEPDPKLASDANVQLPPVGVRSPSPVWKSPKSPK